MMGYIYQYAQEVVSWLWPEHDEIQEAMHVIEELAQFRWSSNSMPAGPVLIQEARKLVPTVVDDQSLTRAQILLFGVYWTRAWVFQELTLSRSPRLFCGNRSVSFESVLNALDV